MRSSFKLKSDMVCTGHALIIGKARITIHLNGKQLTGDGDAGDHGILNRDGYNGVVIRNGRVTGFEDGIRIRVRARNNLVHRIRAFGNLRDGIATEGGYSHLVRRSVVYGNGDDGVDLEGGRAHEVRDTSAHGNDGDGIDLEAYYSYALDNDARQNGRAGISLHRKGNTVKRNHACENAVINYDKNGTYTFKRNTEAPVC